MNLETTLDLDYADPPVPTDLLERVRSQGRRIRRRRRIGRVAGAFVLVAALAVGSWALPRQLLPADRGAAPAVTVPDPLASLPQSIGKGPSADHFAPDGYSPNLGRIGEQIGPATVIAPAQGKHAEELMWMTRNAEVALGSRDRSGKPQATTARPLTGLPKEGIFAPVISSDYAGPMDKREPVRSIITGVVRGPVTKVMIDLPGGAVPAHLGPAPNPDLGTFYWLATDAFDSGFNVNPEADDPAFGRDFRGLAVTVYRGDTPVFHCGGSEERFCKM